MLKNFFEISVGISSVILLLLALTPLLKKRYTVQLRYFLWIFCALVLIIPFRVQPLTQVYIPRVSVQTQNLQESVPAADTYIEQTYVAADNAAEMNNEVKTPKSDVPRTVDIMAALTIIWLSGAAVFMLVHLTGYAVFCKKVKPWCRSAEFVRYGEKPELVECRILKSPMLVGFIRPKIMLPANTYTSRELDMILMHELTHYKRGDLYVKLLFILANALHWFNPFVYIMRRAANRDMEYSCDEKVVSGMSVSERRAYSLTILKCAADGIQTSLSTCFGENKRNLKKRFANIFSGCKKRGAAAGCIVCALALLSSCAFGFSYKNEVSENAVIKANYLFLGTDGRSNIDAIMLASLSDDDKITVTSIPYGTAGITNYCSEDKINELTGILEKLMDCNIKAYLAADTESIVPLLEKVSGVEFTIPDLYGDGKGMVYDDPYQGLHINLPAGTHELTVKEITDVIKYRKGNPDNEGKYMAYDNGRADRIEMQNSLLREIIKQKKKVLKDGDTLQTALEFMSTANTNAETEDIRDIYKAVKKGRVEFKLLDGEYAKDVNLQDYYHTDRISNLNEYSMSPVNAADSRCIKVQAARLRADGAERLKRTNDTFAVWLNERLGSMHMCLIPELTDGNYASIQPYGDIEYKAEQGKATGQFVFKVMTKKEAGETVSKDIFSGTVTGLNTDAPVLESDDGRYFIQMLADKNK